MIDGDAPIDVCLILVIGSTYVLSAFLRLGFLVVTDWFLEASLILDMVGVFDDAAFSLL